MSATMMRGPLKLRACDEEDLQILSAHLQDAIAPVCDLAFVREDRRFVMVVNRFKWEQAGDEGNPVPPDEREPAAPGGAPAWFRTHCGVRFEDVTGVRCRNIDLRQRGRILELLAIQPEEGGIRLCFADGGEIRLETPTIRACLCDIGEPWPTRNRPHHSLDDDRAPAQEAAAALG